MAKKNAVQTILDTAEYNLAQTAKRLKLKEHIYERIRQPRERIEVTLNPALTNHKVINVKAFIVHHNEALGPSKGGIRMTEDVTIDDVTGLAMEMTWKTSLIGVPFGGGKSGICISSKGLKPEDKEILIRSFTRHGRRHLGPEIYVPAPDMGTNEGDMGHIRDCISYSDGMSITRGCFVTGKPVILGGIVGRREATGKGVVYTTLAACEKLGIDVNKATVAVQGFGNVGSVAALEMANSGAKVVAVSDVSGGLYNKDGIDIEKLAAYAKKHDGEITGFKGAQPIDGNAVLETECDILIPAAAQSQITTANAGKIKARIVAEGANSPTTPDADKILNERNIFVIPDILCNAGGVFVSYLEYTQETQREQMTREAVEARLSRRMAERFSEVFQYSKAKKLSMRDSAMDIAVKRVVEATFARGLLP